MHNVGLQLLQQPAERTDLKQAGQRLAVHRQGDVLTAFAQQLLDQSPAIRHHNRAMPGRDQRAGYLQRASLDAAAMQGWQGLKYGEPFSQFSST